MCSYMEDEGVALLRRLYEQPDVPISVDTETTGLHIPGPHWGIGISIAGVDQEGPFKHYFGISHETGENISETTLSMLKYVLEQDRLIVMANAQFDIASCDTMGIVIDPMNVIDICSMAHLINENMPLDKGLDSLAAYYLRDGSEKVKDPFIEQEKVSGNHFVTPEQMWEYAVMDAVLTWRVWFQLVDNPIWTALPDDIWRHKQELIEVLLAMKRRGVRIDTELAQEYIRRGEIEMVRLATEMGYAPKPGKAPVIGSKAMTEMFLERMKLPVVKRTKPSVSHPEGQPSFDKEAMEEYDILLERLDSPLAKQVKSYRGWQKAVSAAYRPYVELLDPDGRLRCSYKLHGTKTGRLSCSKPNLQQVPKVSDKEWNGKVKECFIAEEGYTLINADFSQLELRLGTAYAGEPQLQRVFEEGRDIFTEMASELGMKRQDTKTLVYSMQYGAGLKRIMTVFGVSKVEANRIRNNYFATYPAFKTLSDRIAAKAEDAGQVKLWNGRYRHFQYSSESFKAMNSVIQGGAADIVERCMVRCFQELDSDEECRILLQVHDSITFEVRNDLVEEYMPRIQAVMEDVASYVGHDEFQVRFAVEVELWSAREVTAYAEWQAAQNR